MDSLTHEQQAKLDALVAKLETLPTPELIIESVRIRNIDWTTEEGKALYLTAMAGAIAAQKTMSYLVSLRDIEERRDTLGRQIRRHLSRPSPTDTEGIEDYARSRIRAIDDSGLQEVAVHFFCNCVIHLHTLLKKAAEGAQYNIPAEDLAVLTAYRDLRHYYEHIENRLPGNVNAAEVVRETSTEDGWHIESTLDVDDHGRILFKGQAIDVTAKGLERVEDVVRRTWEQLNPAALDGARQHFLHHPEAIPSPGDVQLHLLARLGGPQADTSRA